MASTEKEMSVVSALKAELIALEGIHGQNPETGANTEDSDGVHKSFLNRYTTRLFGAPFQLLDSVDRRFESINGNLGSEYLREFMLNSPILYIKPGMPKYTGADDPTGLWNQISTASFMSDIDGSSFVGNLLESLVSSTVFGTGKKLQRRMFGFRETYYDYMQHVNYMCRSLAVFLGLTSDKSKFPTGTFINGEANMTPFENIRWENYRMLDGETVLSPWDYLTTLGGTFFSNALTALKGAFTGVVDCADSVIENIVNFLNPMNIVNAVIDFFSGDDEGSEDGEKLAEGETSGEEAGTTEASTEGTTGSGNDAPADGSADTTGGTDSTTGDNTETSGSTMNALDEFWKEVDRIRNEEEGATTLAGVIQDKIAAVEFMVEPVTFEETLTNETSPSMIESAIDTVGSVGSEIAFITGSSADTGLIGQLTGFLGDVTQTAATFLTGITEGVTGGFVTNLISGAMSSIKGQKMIYPEIYKTSNSQMSYSYTINLVSPYGDIYNYYMNILVPLMHLIALASPRMVTSNTVTSPYLVQTYMPGMATCQLGIINTLTIMKNPSTKHVSVNGFPLSVKVTLSVKELYNAMSISPANDPTSFLFNETLNDYMSNLAGLIPSVDTYTQQRQNAFKNMNDYFTEGEIVNDLAESITEKFENWYNPFSGR